MSAEVKTTVVIPVYNTEDYLAECLDSVLAQTQREIEVILVDDGSTDGSPAIERAYAERDPRVRVIQQANLRQGTARNRGLAEAKGDYVYFMDSDDILMPGCFEACHRIATEKQLDFVTFDSQGFVDDIDEDRSDLFVELVERSGTVSREVMDGPTYWHHYFRGGMAPFMCWLYYFDRRFLIDNGLQFVERIYFEDNDWCGRIYMAARRLAYLPEKLHRYRHRPGSNVHAGFTPVLAHSCFDVHEILTRLAMDERDPRKFEIIQNVSSVKDIRLRQFAELEPEDGLRAEAVAFGEKLRGLCLDESIPVEVRKMHVMSLISMAQGVADWPDTPILLTRDLVAAVLLDGIPSEQEAPRVGIYGTGKACRAFLKVFELEKRTCVFLETEQPAADEFCGCPLMRIDDAADLALDAVIITSSKFSAEMRANVERCLGAGPRVYVVPGRIVALSDSTLYWYDGQLT